MKAVLRQLQSDFKAAARIGHPQSLQFAVAHFKALPELASNQALDDGFLDRWVYPLAEILANSRVAPARIWELTSDPSAGVRALAAAALGEAATGSDLQRERLRQLGLDARTEVHRALAWGIGRCSPERSSSWLPVLYEWLEDPSPRLRATALLALGSLARLQPAETLERIWALSDDASDEIKSVLPEVVSAIAASGSAGLVLEKLRGWSQHPAEDPHFYVRVLTASWARDYASEARSLLVDLDARIGPRREIQRAILHLDQHR